MLSEAANDGLNKVWVIGPFSAAQHQHGVQQACSMWKLWSADMQLQVQWEAGSRSAEIRTSEIGSETYLFQMQVLWYAVSG